MSNANDEKRMVAGRMKEDGTSMYVVIQFETFSNYLLHLQVVILKHRARKLGYILPHICR